MQINLFIEPNKHTVDRTMSENQNNPHQCNGVWQASAHSVDWLEKVLMRVLEASEHDATSCNRPRVILIAATLRHKMQNRQNHQLRNEPT